MPPMADDAYVRLMGFFVLSYALDFEILDNFEYLSWFFILIGVEYPFKCIWVRPASALTLWCVVAVECLAVLARSGVTSEWVR